MTRSFICKHLLSLTMGKKKLKDLFKTFECRRPTVRVFSFSVALTLRNDKSVNQNIGRKHISPLAICHWRLAIGWLGNGHLGLQKNVMICLSDHQAIDSQFTHIPALFSLQRSSSAHIKIKLRGIYWPLKQGGSSLNSISLPFRFFILLNNS